jgi:hypothetical protein
MGRVFFGLLILLKIILYSKYESRVKKRHGGCMYALLRWLTSSHQRQSQVSLAGLNHLTRFFRRDLLPRSIKRPLGHLFRLGAARMTFQRAK